MAPEDPSDWWSSAHHSNCGSSRQVGPARMHSDVTHHFHTRGFWLRKKQEQTSERDRRSFTSADMQFPLLDFLFFPAIHPIFGFSPPGRQQRAFALLIASDIPTLTYTSDSREREKKTSQTVLLFPRVFTSPTVFFSAPRGPWTPALYTAFGG